MSPPPRSGFPSRAGVAAAALAALLAPADAGAQLPGPPVPGVKLAPADSAAGDLFACALAVDGDRAVAGSVLDDDLGSASGSLYLFARSGGGWAQAAKVVASDGAAGDQLGFAVGVSGARIAAGAPFRDQVGDTSGSLYLFTQQPNGGFAEAKLVPAGLGAHDELGRSAAVSGVTVAAGAPGDDDRGSSAGAVYVWEVDPATGAPLSVQKLTAADGAAGDGFGYSVALAGGTLLAGAPYDDDGGPQAGSVYVFERQGSSWVQAAKLTAADRTAGSVFGWSVAVSDTRAAVGARLDRGTGAAAGAVYVFEGAGGGWGQTAKLVPPGLAAGEELGIAVALDGDAVVAGARFGAAGGLPRAGAGYVFVRESAGWEAKYRLTSPVAAAGDELGFAVGITGGTVFAGVYRDDDFGTDSGTICVFEELGTGGEPPAADLAIAKSDGRTDVPPGGMLTYTITVDNLGPDAAAGAAVSDPFPSTLAGCSWTCTASAGGACTAAGTGSIADMVTLPAGARATYRATCTVAGSAPGTVLNTARVDPPAGVEDPDSGNNEASDATVIGEPTPPPVTANLSITHSNGAASVVAGGETTYSTVVANAGAAGVTARVQIPFAVGIDACVWSCQAAGGAGCGSPPSGFGPIDRTVPMPAGSSVSYSSTCLVNLEIEGPLTSTATVSIVGPPGVFDPDLSDNAAADSDAVVQQADLDVTKSAEPETVVAGGEIVFTIEVRNRGPSAAGGARVVDDFPEPPLAGCSWTCLATPEIGSECGASAGEGDLDEAIPVLPPVTVGPTGLVVPSIVYTATCQVPIDAGPGSIENVATVTPPAGVVDPNPDNDAGTVGFVVEPPATVADLSITKTDGLAQAQAGQPIEYTIEIANAGPDDASGVRVLDPQPPNLLGVTWACGTENGSGDLDATLDLPAGSSVTCAVAGTVAQGFCGPLENVATVAAPSGVVDPDAGNDAAADQTLIFPPPANGPPPLFNLCASKALLTGPHAPGSTVVYQVLLFNGGPGPLLDGPLPELVDTLPPELSNVVAEADAGAVAVLPGGQVIWNGVVAPGEVVTITITGTVDGAVGQVVSNQGLFGDPNIPPVVPTDDPATPEPLDPTVFTIAGVLEIPALGAVGLALLVALLAAAAVRRLS